MKKIVFSIAAMSAMALAMVSCQKEDDRPVMTTFDATHETEQQSAKTSYDAEGTFSWTVGDKIKIYDNEGNMGIYSTNPYPSAMNRAKLVADETEVRQGATPYVAIYPVGVANSVSAVTLPAIQHSANGLLKDMPMYAQSSSDVFKFMSMCGALRIRAHQDGENVKQIILTTDKNINGDFAVSMNGAEPALTAGANGTKSTTMVLDAAQSISEGDGHVFFMYLPAGTYSKMTITLVNADGKKASKSAQNVTITRGKYAKVALDGNMQFEYQSGYFSVSSTLKVRIAKGNLQYQASTNTWRFAEYPWYVLDYDYNNGASATSEDWFDLFVFGATGHGSRVPYASTSTLAGNSLPNDQDWGDNTISNDGTHTTTWRTLTQAEWDYMLNSRPNASSKRIKAQIFDENYPYYNGLDVITKGRNGYVLLPDDFVSYPDDFVALVRLVNGNSPQTALNYLRANATSCTWNVITVENWKKLEAVGAAFIPCAGYIGLDNNSHINLCSVNTQARYWTHDKKWFSWAFNSGSFNFEASPSANYRGAVRLCSNVVE